MKSNENLLHLQLVKTQPHFDSTPLIRQFESLLTDKQLESAGLKVRSNPSKDAFFIYRASDLIAEDGQPYTESLQGNKYDYIINELTASRFLVPPYNTYLQANFSERIAELRKTAIEDDIPLNEQSVVQALSWLQQSSPTVNPSVFLVNNGNIRLLWKHRANQIGVQFCGDQTIQFVILKDDIGKERVFGNIPMEDFLALIRGLGLSNVGRC